MIPIRLALQGIYSYQSEQIIDFKTLTEGKVFGIFGGVGSGKSTILEAISFALYNKTERIRSNRTYNMMNLRSNTLLIDFEFESDEGERYRFVVSGRRNSRQFHKVATFKRMGYQWKENQWIPLESDKADDIIGLSYENFRRTVIIPQGKFREFLELGDTDRRKMLVELFGLQRFDLSEPVNRLFHTCKLQLEHLLGRQSALEAYTEESLHTLISNLKNTRSDLKKNDVKLQKITRRHSRLQQLAKTYEQAQKVEQELHKLLEKSASMNVLKVDIKRKLYCIEHFKTPLSAFDEKRISCRELDEKILQQSQALNDLQEVFKTLGNTLEGLRPTAALREELTQSLRDIDLLRQMHTLREEKNQLDRRLLNGAKTIAQHKKQVQSLEDKRLKIKKRLDTLLQRIPDHNLLRQWSENYHRLHTLQDQIAELKKELERVEADRHKKSSELTRQLKTLSIEELDADSMNRAELHASIVQLEHQLTLDEKALRAALQNRELEAKLKEQAESLQPGKPCLLCGSTDHPSPLVVEGIEDEIQAYNAQIHRLHHRRKALSDALQYLSAFEAAQQSLLEQFERLKSQYNVKQEEWNAIQNNLPDHLPGYENYPSVEEALQAVNEDQKQIKILTNQLRAVEQEYEIALTELQKYERLIEQLERNRQGAVSGMETLQKQTSENLPEVVADLNDAELQQRALQIKQRIEKEIQIFDSTQAKYRKTQLDMEALEASLQTIKTQRGTLQLSIDQLKESLLDTLGKASFDTLDDVRQVLASSLDIHRAQSEVQAFEERKSHLLQRSEQLKTELDGQMPDKEEYDQLTQQLQSLTEESKALNNRLGSLEHQHLDHLAKLKAKEKLAEDYRLLSQRMENLQLLRNMFRGGGFIDYASTVYLQQLCITANKRFHQLTRHQLSLELRADNTFQVRDYLNEGRVRSVSTLSGGQMFQLSLSLALALADSIRQHRGKGQNFFFLDEGFGTLDKEALRIVFDTLKALRKEDRIVGVISHVEALQEEVDVAVFVENDPSKGTQVRLKR